jgi:hypothetical protein
MLKLFKSPAKKINGEIDAFYYGKMLSSILII